MAGTLEFALNGATLELRTVTGQVAESIRIYVGTDTLNCGTELGFVTTLVRGGPQSKLDKLIPQSLRLRGTTIAATVLDHGELQHDATFTIDYEGLAPVAITLTAAETITNTSIADLLADLNAKLIGTPLAGIVTFVYLSGRDAFTLQTAPNVSGLGLELFSADNGPTSGLAELGLDNLSGDFATTFDTWEEFIPLLGRALE